MPRIEDDEEFIEGLRLRPETVQTITKYEYGHNTSTKLTRFKAHRAFSEHRIYEYILDGTRSGKRLFFHPQKEYLVVIRRNRSGFFYYHCKNIEEKPDGIHLVLAQELGESDWKPLGDIVIPYSEVHRCF
jgi:hypothetical protein